MESSLLTALLLPLPTAKEGGGYLNSGIGATGQLASGDDIYTWMTDTVISQTFSDPSCGDGVCDEPHEYAGFGRFGCIEDCGKYINTTSLTIRLRDLLGSPTPSFFFFFFFFFFFIIILIFIL